MSAREQENNKLLEKIRHIHKESKQRYGAPKIYDKLVEDGWSVSLKRVQRLMRKAHIRSITVKKFRPQTSKTTIQSRENLLNQNFTTTTINQKWVADMTYIHTLKNGWCYLASILDLHSRKIVGYSFSRKMTTDVVLSALHNAVSTQQPNHELLLHTDLGTQYTSEAFEETVAHYGIKQSFSRKGCPYDNACIESFHAILKKEEVNHVQYLDYESAKLAMFQFIESWYNRKRIHGSIGNRTPQAIEDLMRQVA